MRRKVLSCAETVVRGGERVELGAPFDRGQVGFSPGNALENRLGRVIEFIFIQNGFGLAPRVEESILHVWGEFENIPVHRLDNSSADFVPFLQVHVIILDGCHAFLAYKFVMEDMEVTFCQQLVSFACSVPVGEG